ncbi:MAG: sugar phosphate nucleotidyltransferase, partial [Phenylobacterium sp.]
DHGGLIREQLSALGLAAEVLLEPEPRDSAPAMAAAAIHLLKRDEEAVMVVLAADHHVPDAAAFRDAVTGAAPFSRAGRIVTLGIAPTFPSTAYGYIRPGRGETVRTVDAFIEKPDAVRAAALIAEGCLWNSGNFIVPATTLAYELGRLAPEVLEAAEASVETASGPADGRLLGEVFRSAPKISIDYAVMERPPAPWWPPPVSPGLTWAPGTPSTPCPLRMGRTTALRGGSRRRMSQAPTCGRRKGQRRWWSAFPASPWWRMAAGSWWPRLATARPSSGV